MSGDEYVYISSLDNEVAVILRNQSTTFNHIKSQHLNNRITRFKTKISQGRILNTSCVDFQISNKNISPAILLSMIIWSSSSLRHACNFLNVTLFCTAIILVFIRSHAYFVTTHLTLLLMFSMVALFSMTCISNVTTGSLTTFILNSLPAVLSSLCM